MAYEELMQDADDIEDVGLLEESRATSPPGTLWQRAKPSVITTALMCATALITFIITRQDYRSSLDTATYAPWQGPLLDRLPLSLHETQRDDLLIPDSSVPRHIYRLPPSPEVDAAWLALDADGLIAVSEEEVIRAGKDPKLHAKLPEDWGYGQNMYPAVIDTFHQVHCLNLLRKNLITNYEYYYGRMYNFTPPIFQHAHVNHCLDSLLQDLMCQADTHLNFFQWIEGQPGPQPDFAVNRQCRDFSAIRRWYDENTIPGFQEKANTYKLPPGQETRPRFKGWREFVAERLAGYDGDRALGYLEGLPPSCTAT